MKKIFLSFVCASVLISCSQNDDVITHDIVPQLKEVDEQIQSDPVDVELRDVQTGVFEYFLFSNGYGFDGTLYATVEDVYTGVRRNIVERLPFSNSWQQNYRYDFGGPHRVISAEIVLHYGSYNIPFTNVAGVNFKEPTTIIAPNGQQVTIKRTKYSNFLNFYITLQKI